MESNWTSDMTDYATERAKSMDKLSLDAMVRLVTEKGASECPRVQDSFSHGLYENGSV